MNFKHCLIFREVAQTNNFTHAANNLFMTQPAVSHAMIELEKEAGTRLFERLYKSVKLTPTGERLLQEILPVIESFESIEARLPHLEDESPIHIASCITFAQLQLPALLKDFEFRYPHIPIHVHVCRADQSLELLKQGKVDVAFIEGTIPSGPLQTQTFSSYHLCAVAAPDFFKGSRLSLDQLARYPLLLRERGSAVRETFEAALSLKGYRLYASWESVDSEALIEAAKTGLGISILPKVLVAKSIQEGLLKEITIAGFNLSNDISIAINRHRFNSRTLAEFYDFVLQQHWNDFSLDPAQI